MKTLDRSYTIRTAQGRTIRRNRVQLKPAAPPSCHHPRAEVETSTRRANIYQKLSMETAEQTQSCQHSLAQRQSTTFGTLLPQTPVSLQIINTAPVDPQAPDAPSQVKAPDIAPPQFRELTGSEVKET